MFKKLLLFLLTYIIVISAAELSSSKDSFGYKIVFSADEDDISAVRAGSLKLNHPLMTQMQTGLYLLPVHTIYSAAAPEDVRIKVTEMRDTVITQQTPPALSREESSDGQTITYSGPEYPGMISVSAASGGSRILFMPLKLLPDNRVEIVQYADIRILTGSGTDSKIQPASTVFTSSYSSDPLLPEEYLKLYISSPGYYSVSGSDMRNTGIDISQIEPSALSLARYGREIPLLLRNTGDRLTDESVVEFYIDTLMNPWSSAYYPPYNLEEALFLSWDGGPGLRYIQESANLQGNIDYRPKSYRQKVHIEQNEAFAKLGQMDNDQWSDLQEHWFYKNVIAAGKSGNFNFDLQWPASSQRSVSISTRFQGISYGSSEDHVVTILLNGVYVAQGSWKGQVPHYIDNSDNNYNHRDLINGENTLQVVISGDPSITQYYDQSYLDWIDIEYERQYRAAENRIAFSAPNDMGQGSYVFELHGFSRPEITLLKNNYSWLRDYVVYFNEEFRSYSLIFQTNDRYGANQYYAIAQSSALVPDTLIRVLPPSLPFDGRQGDFVIIAPEFRREQLGDFMTHKQEQGFEPVFAPISEIYDRFGDGQITPFAIRDFLSWAKSSWRTGPDYALIIGDAKDGSRLSFRDSTYIPVRYFQTYRYGACITDVWYGDLDEDMWHDVMIGRVPVETEEELQAWLDKTIAYEKDPAPGNWRNRVTMIAGYEDDFKYQSEQIINNYLPDQFMVDRIYVNPSAETGPYYGTATTVAEMLNEGKVLVNFFGHGGGAVWTDRSLFTLEDMDRIHNALKPAFINSMTCFTATFETERGLGESMINHAGGAVGYLGSTGLGWIQNDYLLTIALYRQLFSGNTTFGEALRAGRYDYYTSLGYITHRKTMYYQYNYLGDPSLVLPYDREPDKLVLDPADPSPGSSMTVTFPVSADSGMLDLTCSYNGDEKFPLAQKIPLDPSEGSIVLNIPDTASIRGHVSAVFWNSDASLQRSAVSSFSLQGSYIGTPYFYPDGQPDAGDLRRIRIILRDSDGISSAEFALTDGSTLPLTSLGNDLFSTDELLWTAAQTRTFRVKVTDNSGNVAFSSYLTFRTFVDPDLELLSYALLRDSLSISMSHDADGPADVELNVHSVTDGRLLLKDTLSVLPGISKKYIPHSFSYGADTQRVSVVMLSGDELDTLNNSEIYPVFSFSAPAAEIQSGINLNDRLFGEVRSDITQAEGSLILIPLDSTLDLSAFGALQTDTHVLKVLSDIDRPGLYLNWTAAPTVGSAPYFISSDGSRARQLLVRTDGGELSHFLECGGLVCLAENRDIEPPSISVMLNNRELLNDAYFTSSSQFNILVTDNYGVHPAESMTRILFDGSDIDMAAVMRNTDDQKKLALQFSLETSIGDHSFQVVASDLAGNSDSTDIYMLYNSGESRIIDYGNFPNPFKARTYFIYELTDQFDDLTISIYTISGNRIMTIDRLNAESDLPLYDIGYHEVQWNGRDRNGNFVANGVYFYLFEAVKDNVSYRSKGKIVKIR